MSRKLDAAIAEALGYEVRWERLPMLSPSGILQSGKQIYSDVPLTEGNRFVAAYSTDGNAMLELDREMTERGWRLFDAECNLSGDTYMAVYKKGCILISCVGDTLSLAVALAAYQALTRKEWQE